MLAYLFIFYLYGVLNGPQSGSNSCLTTSWWWLFCLGFNVFVELLSYCAIYFLLRLHESIHGKTNPVVNALSHFQSQGFRHLAPQAEPVSMPIPPEHLTAPGASHLMYRCHFYLTQGLTLSTHRLYLSAQRLYVDFLCC